MNTVALARQLRNNILDVSIELSPEIQVVENYLRQLRHVEN
jgi:hypothetical protein